MRDLQLEKTAALHYDNALPYHNFDHIRSALQVAEDIMARCRSRRQTLDEAAVYYAILFHDAGFREDHRQKGFTYKEEYSAHLARQALTTAKVASGTMDKACEAIRGTRRGFDRKPGPETQVVRAADLAQLAAPYLAFKLNTVNLWRENKILTGKTLPWREWRQKAVTDVGFFLDSLFFVEPGSLEADTKVFLTRARANLTALAQDESVTD